jgi:hypothetical protein
MTNYERIKSMTIEEMVEFLREAGTGMAVWCNKRCRLISITCTECIQEYLESEVEE